MEIANHTPQSFKWDDLPSEKIKGLTGFTLIKSQSLGQIKIRQVEYSKNYLADHWCTKGHVIYVIDGECVIEHNDSTVHFLSAGMSYLTGDGSLAHRLKSENGATLLIVD